MHARGGGGAWGRGGGLSGVGGCGDYLEGLKSLLLEWCVFKVGRRCWGVCVCAAYHGGGGLAGWGSAWVDGLGEAVRFCRSQVVWSV